MADNNIQGQSGTLNTKLDGLSVKSWTAIAAAVGVVVLGFGAWWTYGLDRAATSMGAGQMDGMAAADVPRFPPVAGYYAGEWIFFAHTETSDRKIAKTLTDMMGSPVVTVPRLAQTPETMLGQVYVFTNGTQPEGARGPLGFQPDVFDSAPDDPEYRPLREVQLVTWRDGSSPRTLESAAEVRDARAHGEINIKSSGVVVNMPFLKWPSGSR